MSELWIDVKIPYEPGKQLAHAYNRAMESTTAEWVLFLDQDLFCCNPNWYAMCLNAIQQLEGQKVGWISCKTNRIVCKAQLHKLSTDPDDIDFHIRIARDLYKEHGNKIVEVRSRFSGFFILTNKTAWKSIGGFRHQNKGLSKVDGDYSDRLRKAGFKHYIMPGLYYYHLYKKKWGTVWKKEDWK
jgi:GT2 family glycosyltransferase